MAGGERAPLSGNGYQRPSAEVYRRTVVLVNRLLRFVAQAGSNSNLAERMPVHRCEYHSHKTRNPLL
jgi:hypothetical protein